MYLIAASGFTQHLNPLSSTLASTLVALIPLALLLVLLAVLRMTAWLVVTIGAAVTIVMAITIWHAPAGPTLEAWLIGAATGIWSIDWIVFWGVVIYNVLHETGALLPMAATRIASISSTPSPTRMGAITAQG